MSIDQIKYLNLYITDSILEDVKTAYNIFTDCKDEEQDEIEEAEEA